VISTCYPALPQDALQKTLQVLADRLTNELTRDSSLKALTMIALNQQKSDVRDTPLIPLKNLNQYLKVFFDLLKKT